MKVGIITWHYYPNFGSSLQAYALQETVKGLGFNVMIINYRNPKFSHATAFQEYVRYLLSISVGRVIKRFRYPHLQYMYKYLKQTHPYHSEIELNQHANYFDAVICGSDQIWAPNVFNPIYFASFFPGKKISYAASIGLSSIPEELVGKYVEDLKGFAHVSVREEDGKKVLKEVCGIDADVVLDPTLLIPVERYITMERPVFEISEPFVFCYFLNENHQYKMVVLEYAERNRLKIVGVSANIQDSTWMMLYQDLSPCEFLWFIHHATIVLTDSYHGTIFSLLYHKDFRTYIRFAESDPISQNSRIRQLNAYFGIEKNIQNSNQVIERGEFDYSAFETQLDNLRKKSLSYLKRALEC